jgi:hypothetical protein
MIRIPLVGSLPPAPAPPFDVLEPAPAPLDVLVALALEVALDDGDEGDELEPPSPALPPILLELAAPPDPQAVAKARRPNTDTKRGAAFANIDGQKSAKHLVLQSKLFQADLISRGGRTFKEKVSGILAPVF